MVFGTFDLLHKGHVHFLREAKKHGDRLIVVLAPDTVVLLLKGKPPLNSFAVRLKNFKKLVLADEIVVGDGELGSWNVLERYKPDVVVLGYDQKELATGLKRFLNENHKSAELFFVGPHAGQKLHSSILRAKMVK